MKVLVKNPGFSGNLVLELFCVLKTEVIYLLESMCVIKDMNRSTSNFSHKRIFSSCI